MSTYRISFETSTYATVEVEADNYEDAVEAAYDEVSVVHVCAQCSGWGQTWSRDDGEWELHEKSGYEVDGKYVEYEEGQR